MVLVPAEMLGVRSGLGYQILNARDQLAYHDVMAVMLVIGLLGYLLDAVAQRLVILYTSMSLDGLVVWDGGRLAGALAAADLIDYRPQHS